MSTKDVNFAVIIIVVKESAKLEVEKDNLQKILSVGEGVLRVVEFRCLDSNEPDLKVSSDVCAKLSKNSKPFLVVVPFGSKLRMKLTTSLGKWIFDVSSLDEARTMVNYF